MKGFKFPFEPLKEYTETLSVQCRRCHNVWSEEVTHYGTLAGYARYYDCCEKCYTDEDRKRLGIPTEEEFLEQGEDVCCCGDSMENHESALTCGHSPVSMADYYRASKKNADGT